MKQEVSAIILLLFVCSPLATTAQTPATARVLSPLEQALIASEKSLIEAKKKNDGAFFKRTVTEDFSLVGADGELQERQDALDNLGDSDLLELTAYDIKVVALGEAAAIVTYDAIVREKPEEDQAPPPRYQHFSSVWVRQGDAWKLKFHQATPVHWGDW
jgi:ribonuclease HI